MIFFDGAKLIRGFRKPGFWSENVPTHDIVPVTGQTLWYDGQKTHKEDRDSVSRIAE